MSASGAVPRIGRTWWTTAGSVWAAVGVVRIMQYVSLVYQDLWAGKVILANRLLPSILPIVVYFGDTHWSAPTDMAELVPTLPPSLSAYDIQVRFWLVDLSQPKPDGTQDNVLSAMMEVAHLSGSDMLGHAVVKLRGMLQTTTRTIITCDRWPDCDGKKAAKARLGCVGTTVDKG
ncbi:MAG: Rpn family recombination-promoting nuclease/putative transposase [Alphaproteobacteria bacterium]|nr:Rpn family recombination-promoting nuclease/putative transposase [Alphaproteobacteria bacterium]